MKLPRRPITVEDLNRQTRNAEYFATKALAEAHNFSNDLNRAARLVAGECRYCFYLNTDRLAGSAISERDCGICEATVRAGSTNVPIVCGPCSKAHRICRACGGDMEMKSRRKL